MANTMCQGTAKFQHPHGASSEETYLLTLMRKKIPTMMMMKVKMMNKVVKREIVAQTFN